MPDLDYSSRVIHVQITIENHAGNVQLSHHFINNYQHTADRTDPSIY